MFRLVVSQRDPREIESRRAAFSYSAANSVRFRHARVCHGGINLQGRPAVGALARSGLAWVVGTMRSDSYHHFDELPALAHLVFEGASYQLLPPDEAEIGQIIRQPAREAGCSFETDQQRGVSLDEVIRQAAKIASPVTGGSHLCAAKSFKKFLGIPLNVRPLAMIRQNWALGRRSGVFPRVM